MAKKPSLNTQAVGAAHSQTRATWIATVAAVVAIVISLFSLYESHEARVAAFRDELIIRARRPMGDTQISILNTRGPLAFGAVRVPWEVLISNTGTSTVSITGYNVRQIQGKSGEVDYSGLDKGLVSPDSGEVVGLPISLEAGKSVRLLLVIGLNPGAKAHKVLLAAAGDREARLPLYAAEKLLAKSGIDIYDNPVTVLGSGDEFNGWSVDKQGKEQVFLLTFRTARGGEVSEVTSWYSLKGF